MNAPLADLPGPWAALPLFPLGTVLFPGGLLPLKVFEARYLDLMSHCLRSQEPFAVVHIRQGQELRSGGQAKPLLETTAVLAHLQDVDAEQPGILKVRCTGGMRVLLGATQQRADGLWLAEAQAIEPDAAAAVPGELQPSARALATMDCARKTKGRSTIFPSTTKAPTALDSAVCAACSTLSE